jgi:hypothetical protein
MTSIALTAERGTGKTTLAIAAAERLGARHISVSGWLTAHLEACGIASTSDALRAAGEEAASDPARLVEQSLRYSGWRPGESVVFDAIRHKDVLVALRAIVAPNPVFHVAVVLGENARVARLVRRGDVAAVEFGRGHSTEIEIPALVRAADFVLDGGLTVDELILRIAEETGHALR